VGSSGMSVFGSTCLTINIGGLPTGPSLHPSRRRIVPPKESLLLWRVPIEDYEACINSSAVAEFATTMTDRASRSEERIFLVHPGDSPGCRAGW
jgi:hypothetical protein